MRRAWRRWRRWATAALAVGLLPPLLRLWRCVVRVEVQNDPRPGLRAAGVPYIYALHHGQQLAALLAHQESQPVALVSASRDGELLARVLARLGVDCVRGSRRKAGRYKGGAAALDALAAQLGPKRPAILAVDGPQGPVGVVRRGVLALAARTGAVVLPVAIAADRRRLLQSTWDGTELPSPTARLRVRFGAPVVPPAGATPEEARAWVEAQRPALEAALWALRGKIPQPPQRS